MGLSPITYWYASCDTKACFSLVNGDDVMPSKLSFIGYLKEKGWYVSDNKILCPKCNRIRKRNMTELEEADSLPLKCSKSKVPTSFQLKCLCGTTLIWYTSHDIKLECPNCKREWKFQVEADAKRLRN